MFDRLIVPLDGSALAECVLPHVVSLAKAFGSEVLLLHVLERAQTAGRTSPVDPLAWHISKAEARSYLDDIAARLQGAGVRPAATLLEGPTADSVIEFAAGQGAGLIVLSSHGRSGLSGWNVSSVAQQILLRARRSILIVRAYQPAASDLAGIRYGRVLVPLDCSQRAESVLPVIMTLAQANESHVLAVHALQRPDVPCREPLTPDETALFEQVVERSRRAATGYLESLQARLSPRVETRVVTTGSPLVALHDVAEQEKVDLVVLSAHGQTGTPRWPYGSLTVSFVAYGTTPLLIVQDLAPEELEPSQAEVAASEYKGH